jgi:hypothetical protein
MGSSIPFSIPPSSQRKCMSQSSNAGPSATSAHGIWASRSQRLFCVPIHKIVIFSTHHEDPFLSDPRFSTIVCSSAPPSRRHVVVVAIERRRRRTGGCLCREGPTLHIVVVVVVVVVASTRRDDEESTNDLRHSHPGTS